MTTGNGIALFLVLRAGVKALAEFHDVQTALTERRADRRRRIRRAGRHLELDLPRNLLRHSLSASFALRSTVWPTPPASYRPQTFST